MNAIVKKYNFCTLFDSNYFSRGLTLYNSLLVHCEDFHLFIFAFDNECFIKLSNLQLEKSTIICLSEFEDSELLKIKPDRTKAEYCWTCTSSTILYCIEHFKLDNCTYIDADICFYSNPQIIFDEIGDSAIALTDHNYTKLYDHSATSGRFCVQFVYFNNTENGIKALHWWRDACIEWCYARLEDGKFGDQKYLDDWAQRFENVHVVKNLGVGVAPWNIQQFNIFKSDNDQILLTNRKTNEQINTVFYHYHALKYKQFNRIVEIAPTKYKIETTVNKLIYRPYIESLLRIENTDNNEQIEIVFKNHTMLTKMYLPIHFRLKKIALMQKIKAYFVKSIR